MGAAKPTTFPRSTYQKSCTWSKNQKTPSEIIKIVKSSLQVNFFTDVHKQWEFGLLPFLWKRHAKMKLENGDGGGGVENEEVGNGIRKNQEDIDKLVQSNKIASY